MKRLPIIAGLMFVLGVLTLGLLIIYSRNNKPLPVYGNAPAFQMTAAGNLPFDSAQLQGKVWVADFFFTQCPGPCPTMGKNMQKLAEQFETTSDFALVNISVDPANDDPETLRKYARKFGADTSRWFFLNADADEVRRVSMQGFKIGREEIINHSTRFVLVDKAGQIRGYYEGTQDEDIDRLKEDIKRLL